MVNDFFNQRQKLELHKIELYQSFYIAEHGERPRAYTLSTKSKKFWKLFPNNSNSSCSLTDQNNNILNLSPESYARGCPQTNTNKVEACTECRSRQPLHHHCFIPMATTTRINSVKIAPEIQ